MTELSEASRNYALLLEYDGLAFYGYQSQRQSPTVQESIERALLTLLKIPSRIYGAGRTDTGVHAKGMVINFRSPFPILDEARFLLSMNALTDPGVSVLSMCEVPTTFNA
ncbi:tRNA pseudouridine synthase A, partial [Leptospira perolatii]